MGYSADNLSYVDEVKILAPFSICLKNGEPLTKFHTGKTQTDAIMLAKEELKLNQNKCDAWAFTREGVMEENGKNISTVSVSGWSEGMESPVDFVQRFERTPVYRLLGDPLVIVNGVVLGNEEAKPILATFEKGILSHEDAGPKWKSWH